MATQISPLAVVDSQACIGPDVEIGPFCVVGPDVTIGPGTRLLNNITIIGRVTIGAQNVIHPGVVIGGEPQDISYDGTATQVLIGDNNTIREFVTINRATTKDDLLTTLGSNCFLMANVHIAHDCRVGDRVLMANGTMLGGHVHIHNNATLSGAVAVHHYTTVGSFSFIAGLSRVIQDVPPYMLVEGIPTRPRCVNIVALKRNDFANSVVRGLNEAYRLLFRSRIGLENAREILKNKGLITPEVNHLLNFVRNQGDGRHGRARDQRRAA